jgi:hypothetical protein
LHTTNNNGHGRSHNNGHTRFMVLLVLFAFFGEKIAERATQLYGGTGVGPLYLHLQAMLLSIVLAKKPHILVLGGFLGQKYETGG